MKAVTMLKQETLSSFEYGLRLTFLTGGGAAASWSLQDGSHVISIVAGLVAIVSGCIYSYKMLLDIRKLRREDEERRNGKA